jgi:ZIP family zinc transporter
MLSAFIFGLVASSALVTGAVAGAYWTPPRPLLAAALAFASGVLMPAGRQQRGR